MAKYKNILNPFTGKLQKIFSGDLVSFKSGVISVGNLPSEGNENGDGRIVNDTGHLYIWDGSTWQDQGDIIDLKWASIENKPSSSVGAIDDAVTKKHDRQHSIVDGNDHSDKIDYIDIPYSPTILTGGIISEGTNAGTIKVSALTALIRIDTSSTDVLKKITLAEQDNQAIGSANIIYYIVLDYNADSPQVVIQEAEPNNNNQIQIGRCLKNDSNEVHYRQSGLRLQHGTQKTNEIFRHLGEWMIHGVGIADKGSKKFSITSGHFFRGLTKFDWNTFDTSLSNTFTYAYYNPNTSSWVFVEDQTDIDVDNYNNKVSGDGLATCNRYKCDWVFVHPDDGDVYVVYGENDDRLGIISDSSVPILPDLIDVFGALIGRIIIDGGVATFERIEMIQYTTFNPQVVIDHNDNSNIQGGTIDENYHLTSAEHTNKYIQGNELKIKVYSQDAEPTLSANEYIAIWKHADDSNRIYLIFRRGEGDQVSVELA